jgi:hypothetical protein
VRKVQSPSERMVILADHESFPFQIGSKVQYRPEDSETFLLRFGVVLLGPRETAAPVADRVLGSVRLILKEGTPYLLVVCVRIEGKHSLDTGNRRGGRIEQVVTEFLECG